MAAGSASDPELSAAGHTRATSLASMLKDARITAIFVTEFRRTRQTAEPLAKQLAIEPTVVSSNDLAALLARLKATSGNALVVGHSNTVPAVLEGLGVQAAITIGEDYDNLFIVTRTPAASLVRLRYR
jgi:broad specificity phosphatase PhoE